MSGQWPADQLARLRQGALPLEAWPAPAEAQWSARGELRARPGGKPQVWLHLAAQCRVTLTCQRCLQPVHEPLSVERDILFAATEAEAEALDEELEEDVMVLPRALDLQELVEDELILALPLVPRHADCQLPLPPAQPLAEVPKAHPFAALASLKRPG